ncbi:sulfite oxidase-like oxidoreductase [Thermostichus vulcanus]|uniref:Sulfite oxidase-like oxidoreductase n=1 Tax=Thermostichus vulcanus str. 'Rupite' TaxID=2813851 RepID=A0ABT0C937_THEVL|nr:sulfite oxidase-like oxidoreductase [Thermostichus vulcanus str. 'Rupite']
MGKFFQKLVGEDPLSGRVPPGQHLARGFPVFTYGDTPVIQPEEWQLRIWGCVEKEVVITWEDLLALPQHTFTADFHCVTRWSKLDVTWAGVRIPDLLAAVSIRPEAKAVMQHCYGGYTTNLTLEEFIRPENYIVHTLEGERLPVDHGGPVRTLIPHLYAWKSAKWISGLEFLPEDQPGFSERNGYHMRGEPWSEERYSDL